MKNIYTGIYDYSKQNRIFEYITGVFVSVYTHPRMLTSSATGILIVVVAASIRNGGRCVLLLLLVSGLMKRKISCMKALTFNCLNLILSFSQPEIFWQKFLRECWIKMRKCFKLFMIDMSSFTKQIQKGRKGGGLGGTGAAGL